MSSSKVLLGLVAGLATGAMLGILLAPDSGENTRKKISKKGQSYVDDLKSKFSDFVDGFMENVDSVKNDARDKADDVIGKAKSKYNEIKTEVKKATDY